MILRLLNLVVIGALVFAAAYVYRIKFNSTVQAEHLAKLRGEVRHERDVIATLRAEWGQLDSPARIEGLAKRYLHLKPIAPTQFDTLDHLPDRPLEDARSANDDPIGGMIGDLEVPDTLTTGSIPASAPADGSGLPSAPLVTNSAADPQTGGAVKP